MRRSDMTPFYSRAVICFALAAALAGTVGEQNNAEWQNWQSDVTDSMGIGPSLTGYRRVGLRCAAEHMDVELEMEDDFEGVIYARGAFHSRQAPCFLDATGGRNFSLRLPLDQCNTKNDNDVFSNTIIIQYDDELIMPGDAAFKLNCDFQKPKAYTVAADLSSTRNPISSRIILEDADPAAQDNLKEERISVYSDSDSVTFTPKKLALHSKDEL